MPEATAPQSTAVLMPKIGQAMAEGTILQWHYQDGEHVEQGVVLVTIETDKATYDLEAQASGTLHIYMSEGQEVTVGTLIGEIGEATHRANAASAPTTPPPTTVVTQAKSSARKRVLASPKAKQLAAAHSIELATVTPSNADGIISAADVEKAIAARKPATPAPQETSAGRSIRERRKLTGIRKTSARRVQEAWQVIPHIVQMVDVDATALLAARTALKAEAPSLTLNDLILHAAVRVMAGLPELNGTIEDDSLVLYEGVDIGFAADTPRGLVVPVIRRADTLSLGELAAESQRLIEAARAGRLGPENIGGASLTVSNLGMFGIRAGTPVINLGEPILVFVGAVEDRPVVVNGQIVVRPMLTLSIAYDHRVADGVAASQFTRGLKESLGSSVQRLESKESSASGVRRPASEARKTTSGLESDIAVLASSSSTNPQSLAPSTQHPAPSTQAELGKRELRAVSAGSSYAVGVRSRSHTWVLDEPAVDGGTDTGPDPVSAFLGALLSCMTISFKAVARRRKVTIERLEGRVQGTPQGHVKDLAMTLEIWSPDPEENVRGLLEPAKRGCYVSGVLKPEIAFQVNVILHSLR
ncbi:MAG: 2-oxo acid dehydrogenase subunit E2 [Deltaproteobacteria bacterium]|nr:2-oxo acid dehydrogenase subunit E2 [Deltaproteobacteria bacterium]